MSSGHSCTPAFEPAPTMGTPLAQRLRPTNACPIPSTHRHKLGRQGFKWLPRNKGVLAPGPCFRAERGPSSLPRLIAAQHSQSFGSDRLCMSPRRSCQYGRRPSGPLEAQQTIPAFVRPLGMVRWAAAQYTKNLRSQGKLGNYWGKSPQQRTGAQHFSPKQSPYSPRPCSSPAPQRNIWA